MSILSLPLEIRTIIYNLALLNPTKPHLRICKPSERFAYEGNPDHITDCLARIKRHRRRTRLSTQVLLPQRPRDYHKSRTAISLLLVCRQIYDEASAIYYGKHAWEIGIHGRMPSFSVFKDFLDVVGARNRPYIRSVVVLSRFGYGHLWGGPPLLLVNQLQRCDNLRNIIISMTGKWAVPLQKRRMWWKERCLEVWKKELASLEDVQVWNQDDCGYSSHMQRMVDDLLKLDGLVPTDFNFVVEEDSTG